MVRPSGRFGSCRRWHAPGLLPGFPWQNRWPETRRPIKASCALTTHKRTSTFTDLRICPAPAPEYARLGLPVSLTSVTKCIAREVKAIVLAAVRGTFRRSYFGSTANEPLRPVPLPGAAELLRPPLTVVCAAKRLRPVRLDICLAHILVTLLAWLALVTAFT